MNTLRIENNTTGFAAKFANFLASFFSTEAKTQNKKDAEPKGHSFIGQATRLGCDMSHFNYIS